MDEMKAAVYSFIYIVDKLPYLECVLEEMPSHCRDIVLETFSSVLLMSDDDQMMMVIGVSCSYD